MKVTFYGVRGSIPTPGPDTVKYGGNTACVFVEAGNSKLILDAGTGLVSLGEKLAKNSDPITLILSHNHWDHIQGFPFFIPAYQKDREITIYSAPTDPVNYHAILTQMSMSTFPVEYTKLLAKIELHHFPNPKFPVFINGFNISSSTINHPNGGLAYKIQYAGKQIAYITDNEIHSSDNLNTSFEQWIEFVNEVDLLIHDAQYTDTEMPSKLGWGHSSIDQAVELAIAAKVKHLVLYSHAPERTDKDLDAVVKSIKVRMGKIKLSAAREGKTIEV